MASSRKKKIFALLVLDGWGLAPVWGGNAISTARTKNFSQAFYNYPHTTLHASGDYVGLPYSTQGNSEAGHLNIGAGYVVHQDGLIIDKEIESGEFFENQVLCEAVDHAIKNKSNLHLLGLISTSTTHSSINQLYALLKLVKEKKFNKVYLHLFTDGRDSDPMSGIELVVQIDRKTKEIGIGKIATLVGRFYAMDRDNRWERIKKAYDLMVKGIGKEYQSAGSAVAGSYSHGITDEFLEPSLISNKLSEATTISDNDAVILFNFRGDRTRQIIKAFVEPDFDGFARKKLNNLYFCSFIMNAQSKYAISAFKIQVVKSPLAHYWSEAGLSQYHTAETEKYPHITFYLNGGLEKSFPGEERLVVPSPKGYDTYDMIPQMSIRPLTDALIGRIKSDKFDCYAINFANPDMVGHTGNLKATIQAVEYTDEALGRIITEVLAKDGTVFITADHGNAEQMVNPKTGMPDTEHTENPVPFIIVDKDPQIRSLQLRQDSSLSSITPTILDIMNIKYKDKDKSLIIK